MATVIEKCYKKDPPNTLYTCLVAKLIMKATIFACFVAVALTASIVQAGVCVDDLVDCYEDTYGVGDTVCDQYQNWYDCVKDVECGDQTTTELKHITEEAATYHGCAIH
ncbi:hypothetical protein PoB_005403500 [Plakobranchus ocellatus]|uniref:Uncharacterized protein n=1 Tax=Plakobranchus ocellatus TaxID=259542 RepID=A0AAV4C769_9GAST|nr:hypothetical protein PoB_005403500 [Plakobranchus ocellatus]